MSIINGLHHYHIGQKSFYRKPTKLGTCVLEEQQMLHLDT